MHMLLSISVQTSFWQRCLSMRRHGGVSGNKPTVIESRTRADVIATVAANAVSPAQSRESCSRCTTRCAFSDTRVPHCCTVQCTISNDMHAIELLIEIT